jgi:hypothetical protein
MFMTFLHIKFCSDSLHTGITPTYTIGITGGRKLQITNSRYIMSSNNLVIDSKIIKGDGYTQ